MIKVNETCIGCGACVAMDPEHFDFNEGVSVAISQEVTDSVREAAGACPVGAIEIEEAAEATLEVVKTAAEEENDDMPMAA